MDTDAGKINLDCAGKAKGRRRFRTGSTNERRTGLKAGILSWPQIFTDETQIKKTICANLCPSVALIFRQHHVLPFIRADGARADDKLGHVGKWNTEGEINLAGIFLF